MTGGEYMGICKTYLATHRCEGSLKQMASIRYLTKDVYTRQEGWFLHEHVSDWDYFVEYIRKVYPIRFCPFCGQE